MTTPPPDLQQQPDSRVLALVAAEAALRTRATAQAVAMASSSARQFTGWYDSGRVAEWAAKLAALIEAVQRSIAQATDAYLARVLSEMTGSRLRPVGRVDVADLRAGVTHAGAYGRAADAYRWQQHRFDQSARDLLTTATPAPFDLVSPAEAAARRAAAVADMDAQLAFRAQSQRVMSVAAERGTVTGFRRVIHPELSRSGSCGLCIAASDRLYGPQELLPLHARCCCTTLPVLDHADPGSVLNAGDLARLYREAGGTNRAGLKGTRYQVDEHGELGPLLNRAGVRLRSEQQARRDAKFPARSAKSAEEKVADLRRIRAGLDAALPKARGLAASDPGTWGAYLSALEDRLHGLDDQLAA